MIDVGEDRRGREAAAFRDACATGIRASDSGLAPL